MIVSKAEAKCIADNVDFFLESREEQVVIYLDICLSLEQHYDLARGKIGGGPPTKGGNLPGIPPWGRVKPKLAKSITVSRAVLLCLKRAAAAPDFPSTDPVTLAALCQ